MSIAGHSGNPYNLPFAYFKGQPVQRLAAMIGSDLQIIDNQERITGRSFTLLPGDFNLAPNHKPRQFQLISLGSGQRCYHFSFAHDRNPV
ncbi:hypothetical protein D3C75_1073010 [compost metagenome]